MRLRRLWRSSREDRRLHEHDVRDVNNGSRTYFSSNLLVFPLGYGFAVVLVSVSLRTRVKNSSG